MQNLDTFASFHRPFSQAGSIGRVDGLGLGQMPSGFKIVHLDGVVTDFCFFWTAQAARLQGSANIDALAKD